MSDNYTIQYRSIAVLNVCVTVLLLLPAWCQAEQDYSQLSSQEVEELIQSRDLLTEEELEDLLSLAPRCSIKNDECTDTNNCAKTSGSGTKERKCVSDFGGGEEPSTQHCKCLWVKKVVTPPTPSGSKLLTLEQSV